MAGLRFGRTRVRRLISLPVVSAFGAVALGAALLVPLGSDAAPRDIGGLALLTESEAMDAARASGQPVVASALTTSTTIVTAMPEEGVFRAEISPIPVRVQDPASGSWNPVDNSLVEDEDGVVRPVRPAVPMQFSTGGEAPLVSIADSDASMALSWPGALPEPTLVGTAAVYKSVMPDVDLVARAGTLGFSTYLVVHTPQAAQHPMVREFAFDVQTVGGELSKDAGGHLAMTNDSGDTVFRASQPLTWAAADPNAQPAAEATGSDLGPEEEAVGAPLAPPAEVEPVRMSVDATSDRIELTAPASALADTGAAWPRVLDPGFTATTGNDDIPAWTMLWSNGMEFYNDPSEDARVGRDEWSSAWKTARSYFKIDISSLNGDKVHKAVFTHKQIHSPNSSCSATSFGPAVQVGLTSSALSSSSTWGNKPGWWDSDRVASNSAVNGHESTCGGYITQEWNLTGSLQVKTGDSVDSIWIAMRSADEGDKNGWRRYDNNSSYPKLAVDYSIYPDPPTGLTVGDEVNRGEDGWWTPDATPTLSAAVHSPNTGGARVRFEIFQGSTSVWDGETSGGSNGTVLSKTVPAGELSDGTYTVKAWSVANPDPAYPDTGTLTSKTYASKTFHLDTVRPAAPTVSLQNKGQACRVASECRFLFTYDGPEEIWNFRYGLNTDSPTSDTSQAGDDRKDYEPVTATVFGPAWMSARTVDMAGNLSTETTLFSGFRIDGGVLAHQWNLDTSATRTDGSKSSPDGVPTGGVELTVPVAPSGIGPVGTNPLDITDYVAADKTLVLNGTSQNATTTGSGAPLDTSQDFSVSTWVKLTEEKDAIVLSQTSGGLHDWYLGYIGGAWKFKGYTSTGTAMEASVDLDGSQLNKWVHLVGSYDQQTGKGTDQHGVVLRVTLDGVTTKAVAKTADMTGPLRSAGWGASTGQLLIGRSTSSGGSASWFWPGAVDDVRVFPGVLDDSQVRRIVSERRTS